jgi:hypothetical protein
MNKMKRLGPGAETRAGSGNEVDLGDESCSLLIKFISSGTTRWLN